MPKEKVLSDCEELSHEALGWGGVAEGEECSGKTCWGSGVLPPGLKRQGGER